jgi:hypothetical protein
MRYRRESGELLVDGRAGWKDGIVGRAMLAVDQRSLAGHQLPTRGMMTFGGEAVR